MRGIGHMTCGRKSSKSSEPVAPSEKGESPGPWWSAGSTTRRTFNRRLWWPAVLVLLAAARPAGAIDHVSFLRGGRQYQIAGRLLVTAQDGGLLVLERDGVLWAIPPEEQVSHTSDNAPFEPFARRELAARLLAELPDGFQTHETAHYLILYDTSPAYAQWCASLFERLYFAFTNFWTRRGFELKDPEFPLVAIIFADHARYLEYSRPEVGDVGDAVIGYFSLRTNRITMYDLTGVGAAGSPARVQHFLAQPDTPRTVATIVHEATHQIAFNCGLHARYSDCPLWFSEGIAIYFETPDLSRSTGWRGIGTFNRPRLAQFQQYLRHRPRDSLYTLIADNKRFQDVKQSLDAYAESWALTYYLLRVKPRQYIEYLKVLSQKKPLLPEGPEERVAEFEAAFGSWRALDAELVRYFSRLR